jgi:hypothetical protein
MSKVIRPKLGFEAVSGVDLWTCHQTSIGDDLVEGHASGH